LTKPEAANLVNALVNAGPRPAAGDKSSGTSGRGVPVLGQSSYTDLLSTVVDAALKAAPAPQTSQPARRGGAGLGNNNQQPLTDAQVEQNNARRLLAGLQQSLPLIDQYLPSKASLVRQKMTELGMGNNSTGNMMQAFSALQGNPTADARVQAAAATPQQRQSRLYQQAAYKALEHGDTDRARQIANDHLQSNAKDAVMQ